MKAVLLGSDFVYDKLGNLVPIEINTNVSQDSVTVEEVDSIINLDKLLELINLNNFTKITYIGSIFYFSDKLEILCNTHNIEYIFVSLGYSNIIPFIEDTPDHLIIRSAYDINAIVDTEYCANKVKFMDLIKSETFGSQFAYLDDNNTLVNNITTILDNGNHPNFILKSILPNYNKSMYPKLFKVSSSEELNIILEQLSVGYFLMDYHFNIDKLYLQHTQVKRVFNLLFPPNLESISIGGYTRLPNVNCDELSTFDTVTYEISYTDRFKYLTDNSVIHSPKLMDDDKVEMGDDTFKTALELEIGDVIKTIIIPNPHNVSLDNDLVSFGIDYNTFITETVYSTNKIVDKYRVDKLTNYVIIGFTDGTTWEDTASSNYLVLQNNIVRFVNIGMYGGGVNFLNIGDQIILVDTSPVDFTSVIKTVSSINMVSTIFSGWVISVEERYIFLTQTTGTTSYAAIEHNLAACIRACYVCGCSPGCSKDEVCNGLVCISCGI
jgi:hypothetical protein